MEIKPIAIFHTRKKKPYEAARQGTADISEEIGEIQFLEGEQFEQALEKIESFSHLWLIYAFHQNEGWKPKVMPPRGSDQKVGVLATRSPYRPNGLGLSCVELISREDLVLKVRGFDLLDQTPIFDVKPYLRYSDSFPEASMGWLEGVEEQEFQVVFSEHAQTQIQFLKTHGVSELENFLQQQLSFDPFNSQKKRVQVSSPTAGVLAYRTWRAAFTLREPRALYIEKIFSGYSEADLNSNEDRYNDKSLHREFQKTFTF